MLEKTDPKTLMVFNAMDKDPFPHNSLPTSNVIFIGDANHAISPFAGAGANGALMDGWDLAESLAVTTSSPPTLAEALTSYDTQAIPRANTILRMSHFTIRMAHAGPVMHWVWAVVLRFLYWAFLRRHIERVD